MTSSVALFGVTAFAALPAPKRERCPMGPLREPKQTISHYKRATPQEPSRCRLYVSFRRGSSERPRFQRRSTRAVLKADRQPAKELDVSVQDVDAAVRD